MSDTLSDEEVRELLANPLPYNWPEHLRRALRTIEAERERIAYEQERNRNNVANADLLIGDLKRQLEEKQAERAAGRQELLRELGFESQEELVGVFEGLRAAALGKTRSIEEIRNEWRNRTRKPS